MVDVRHKTLAEVRMTIRREIEIEQSYLNSTKRSQLQNNLIGSTKAQAHIDAYRSVLCWLADLEA